MDTVAKHQKEERMNELGLELIKGGKPDGLQPPMGEDWLSRLAVGSLFFVQRSNVATEFSLGLFHKEAHEGKVVRLRSLVPMMDESLYVNPSRFCNVFSLFEDLGVKQVKEEDNEQHHQVEEPGGVERHEGQQA